MPLSSSSTGLVQVNQSTVPTSAYSQYNLMMEAFFFPLWFIDPGEYLWMYICILDNHGQEILNVTLVYVFIYFSFIKKGLYILSMIFLEMLYT